MSPSPSVFFGAQQMDLRPSPINPEWIIEGAPVARAQMLSRSADESAFTVIWDCTAGTFNWYFTVDETVYLLEGSVVVRDDRGAEHRIAAGEHAFFPAGTRAVWHVETYVRKVAFCRSPIPRPLVLARNLARKILVAMGLRQAVDVPAFGGCDGRGRADVRNAIGSLDPISGETFRDISAQAGH